MVVMKRGAGNIIALDLPNGSPPSGTPIASTSSSPNRTIARKSAELARAALQDLDAVETEETEVSQAVAYPSTLKLLPETLSNAPSKRIHCTPVHVSSVHSPLSNESIGSSYRGFINLTILLLAVNMMRLVIENLTKYGLLLSIPGKYIPLKDYGSLVVSLLIVLTCVLIAWGSEWLCFLRAQGSITHEDKLRRHSDQSQRNQKVPLILLRVCALSLIFLNFALLLIFPAWIIWTHAYHPTTGFIALLTSLTLTMKLVSYHVVNMELRALFTSSEADDKATLKALYPDCIYPDNLSLSNLLYFWCAPTLCYQPHYPSLPKIRKIFLAKRLCECASALVAMYVMIEQYAVPTVRNSLKSMDELDWIPLFERVLKLSTTSLYIWLLGFYAFFHSFLNAMAEVLKFGDRGFYRDWWNARTIDEYWRLWNAPVHFWLKRHVYIPLRKFGFSPLATSVFIFFLSALGHEYLVAVATHIVQGWALGAMLGQIPLIMFTRWFLSRWPNSSFGNYFFWVTFCILGMPMCVLFYYRAWIIRENF